jgi:hypothetical protein
MGMPEAEGKKAELVDRIDRLRDLVVADAPAEALAGAFEEVGRSLDGLTRPGRAEGESGRQAAGGEAPPAL